MVTSTIHPPSNACRCLPRRTIIILLPLSILEAPFPTIHLPNAQRAFAPAKTGQLPHQQPPHLATVARARNHPLYAGGAATDAATVVRAARTALARPHLNLCRKARRGLGECRCYCRMSPAREVPASKRSVLKAYVSIGGQASIRLYAGAAGTDRPHLNLWRSHATGGIKCRAGSKFPTAVYTDST